MRSFRTSADGQFNPKLTVPSSDARLALAPVFSDYVEDVVLAANTPVSIPIPAGAGYVIFSFDGDFRAKVGLTGTTIAEPSATTTDGSGSDLNPSARQIPKLMPDNVTVPTHIKLFATAARKGSLSLYRD